MASSPEDWRNVSEAAAAYPSSLEGPSHHHQYSLSQRPPSAQSSAKEQKRRPKPKDGTLLVCGVCGDKALGYNFDAVTCESCKAFFRRNANKSKTFTCSFDGCCKLDPHTRKFCSGCRLKKCFTIGMKKDWILSDDQLAKRRKRLRERTSASNSVSSLTDLESPSSSGEISSSTSYAPVPLSPEMKIKEEPCDKAYNAVLDFPPKQEELSEDDNYSIPLRGDICENLTMIQKTYDEIFEASYTEEQARAFQANPKSSNELFNMTDIFIRRLIKFAKCIPEFKGLQQEDQIHLLKGGIMEMFVLRSAMGFDLKTGVWKHKKLSMTSGTTKEGKLDPQAVQNHIGSKMYVEHMNFIAAIHQLTNSDRVILMLLFVIDLMSSDRPNLHNKLLVSQGQEKFSMWLKAYLESIYTVAEARVLYPKLLMKLLDVRSLGEESSQMAATLDITKLEPLLVEVFDLKK